MLLTFLAGWLIIQLIILGLVTGHIYNKVIEKKYIPQGKNKKVNLFVSSIFPLVLFTPDNGINKIINKYCEEYNNNL